MMRIQMITLMAGPDGVFQAGEVVELPAKQARALIDGGYAVAAAGPLPASPEGGGVETAAVEPAEKAVKPAPKRRKAAPKKAAGGK